MAYKQFYNDELVQQLLADFQARYEPNFAWKSACSQYLALTGLRGFWPLSSFDQAGNAYDLSGQGRTLTYIGNPTYNFDGLAPYLALDGTGDYLRRTDEAGLDILGTETSVAAAARGLTVAVWFYPEETSTLEILVSKWAGAGQRSWRLYLSAADALEMCFSDDGTNFDTATSAAAVMNQWYFVCGRVDPGAFVYVTVNDTTTSQATARASIFNSNANFCIGANSTGGNPFQGRVSMAPLCGAFLSDAIVGQMYQQTRAMFGV